MVASIADETPILETVFVEQADDATDIKVIAEVGLPQWYWSPLSYRELLEWSEEEKA